MKRCLNFLGIRPLLPVMVLQLLLYGFLIIYIFFCATFCCLLFIFFVALSICSLCWKRTVNICATRYEHLFWLRVTINMAISLSCCSGLLANFVLLAQSMHKLKFEFYLCTFCASYFPPQDTYCGKSAEGVCAFEIRLRLQKVHELKIWHISLPFYVRIFRYFQLPRLAPLFYGETNTVIPERMSSKLLQLQAVVVLQKIRILGWILITRNQNNEWKGSSYLEFLSISYTRLTHLLITLFVPFPKLVHFLKINPRKSILVHSFEILQLPSAKNGI